MALTSFGLSGGGTQVSYKKYVAILTQTGTDAPVATELENTIGTMTWAYVSTGVYTVSNVLLTPTKTICFIGGNTEETTAMVKQQDTTTGSIKINSLGDYTIVQYNDGIILRTSIEIRVYP